MREFVNAAFSEIGVNLVWRGAGLAEQGIDSQTGEVRVEIDPRYFRPTEVDTLLGDPAKAKEKLGWEAQTSFEAMVSEMVCEDLNEAERDKLCQLEGHRVFNYHE